MKKKIVAAMLIGAMALSLVACGGSSDESAKEAVVEDVESGTGDKLGKFAYITLNVDDAKEMSGKEFADFCKEQVKENCPEDCMRFVIDFDNGYGISFASGNLQLGQYGKLDDEKMISETVGVILLGDEGFSYKESN